MNSFMAARRGAAGTRAINPRVRGGARGQRTSLRQERFSISGAIDNLPNKVVDQENGHLLPVLVHLIVLDVRQHLHTSRLSLSRKHEAHSCGSVLSSNLFMRLHHLCFVDGGNLVGDGLDRSWLAPVVSDTDSHSYRVLSYGTKVFDHRT